MHFRAQGYRVVGAGKIYHETYRRDTDWDEYLPQAPGEAGDEEPASKRDKLKAGEEGGVGVIRFKPLDVPDEEMVDFRSVTWCLDQLAKPRGAQPLFLACGIHKPHMPWDVPRKYYDLYPPDKVRLPKVLTSDLDDIPPAGVKMARAIGEHALMLESGRWPEAVRAYLAAITFCDAMVGRLLDGFDKSAYKDDTIICLWSDHGWNHGEKEHWRKSALWEETTRAPFLMLVPGMTKPGSVCARTIDYTSVYPTLCDLCGLPVPPHVKGPSLRPLLENPAAPWDRPAVTTHEFQNHAVRSERWRYIRYADGGEELYDEQNDPFEWTNLANDAQHATAKAELAKWLPTVNVPAPAKTKGAGK